jgi:hypothetical protein
MALKKVKESRMEKLTREEVEAIKKVWEVTEHSTFDESIKILDTALILYAENEKMKAGIEGLKGRVIEAHDEGVDDGMKAVMDRTGKLRKEWDKCLQATIRRIGELENKMSFSKEDEAELKVQENHKNSIECFLRALCKITGVGKIQLPEPPLTADEEPYFADREGVGK